MFRTVVLAVVGGVALCCSLCLCTSCGLVRPAKVGDNLQPLPPQEPPPADYTQPVIGQRAEYRKEMAKDTRDAAYTFQKQGLIKQAIIKYRESLAWWPDPALDGYIETVEKAAGLPPSGQRRPWTASPRPPSSKREVIATIRNGSDRDVYIVSGDGPESPETRFLPGEIREMAVLPDAYGVVAFTARRDGVSLATVNWTGDPGNNDVVPAVLFDDGQTDKLATMTGFRPK